MKWNKISFAAFFFAGFSLTAEVYWPGPGGRRSAQKGVVPQTSFTELTEQKSLLTEPAVYNGVRTEIRVSLLHQSLENLLNELRSRYPGLKFQISRAGVLFSIQTGKKYREKVLLVGDGDRVTAFVMQLPEPLPECPAWPAELPLPAGAEPEELIRLPRRGTYYGAFRNAAPNALARSADQASGLGFIPVTGEASGNGGKGELFSNTATHELLTISIAEDGTGIVIRSKIAK